MAISDKIQRLSYVKIGPSTQNLMGLFVCEVPLEGIQRKHELQIMSKDVENEEYKVEI